MFYFALERFNLNLVMNFQNKTGRIRSARKEIKKSFLSDTHKRITPLKKIHMNTKNICTEVF